MLLIFTFAAMKYIKLIGFLAILSSCSVFKGKIPAPQTIWVTETAESNLVVTRTGESSDLLSRKWVSVGPGQA